jgi:D-beta-D-heptose 7-phosphate kinase/D-beta-D-heptose 1-phosphate adenosyltransferase
MIDQFLIGSVTRISPEAPVPIVHFDHEENRIGGAANVAHNVVALGARAEIAGLVGQDAEATVLRGALAERRVGTSGLVADASRPTTRKVRVVTDRHQQVARLDYEQDHEAAEDIESQLIARARALAATAGAIVVSDYLKGAVTGRLVAELTEVARSRGVPLLVDPKIPHIGYYRGATLVTPNHHEAEIAAHMRIRSDDDARQAARAFRERAGCEGVLITRGEHGMWLLAPDGEFDLPAEAREVADVTGAGDTVIAAMAIGLAGGGSLQQAARLANRAAGLAVSHFGPTAVSAVELREALQAD